MCNRKIVSEYDQEIPQSQTADNPVPPREEPLNLQETPGRQIKQSNQSQEAWLSYVAVLAVKASKLCKSLPDIRVALT